MAEPVADKPPKARKPRAPKQPPPEADAAPRSKPASGAAKRTARKSRELALIESGLTELLTFPAMPAAMAKDEWAVDHFTERGPALAARVTAECERNEQLRRMVLKLVQGQGYMMLAIEVVLYAAPAAMHYGILPGADKLGVPVLGGRGKAPRGAPAGAESHGARQRPPEPQTPPQAAQEPQEAPAPEPWEVAQEAARMNGEIGDDVDLGYTPAPPPIEPA